MRGNADRQPSLTFTPSGEVEVRLPCELPFPGQEANMVARAKLVLVSAEPDLPAELNKLRADANPDKATQSPPDDLRRRVFHWRLLRIESDLSPVQSSQRPAEMGGAPGGQ
jgi:hypothetical protein